MLKVLKSLYGFLMRKRIKLTNRPLPLDEDFLWPKPSILPPIPKVKLTRDMEETIVEPMEIKVVEPGPEVPRKPVELTYDEIHMLVDAANIYYQKYMKHVQRSNQPRTKKESIELGVRQQLFQRMARIRNEWYKEGEEE
jgi:hypothetical protein